VLTYGTPPFPISARNMAKAQAETPLTFVHDQKLIQNKNTTPHAQNQGTLRNLITKQKHLN